MTTTFDVVKDFSVRGGWQGQVLYAGGDFTVVPGKLYYIVENNIDNKGGVQHVLYENLDSLISQREDWVPKLLNTLQKFLESGKKGHVFYGLGLDYAVMRDAVKNYRVTTNVKVPTIVILSEKGFFDYVGTNESWPNRAYKQKNQPEVQFSKFIGELLVLLHPTSLTYNRRNAIKNAMLKAGNRYAYLKERGDVLDFKIHAHTDSFGYVVFDNDRKPVLQYFFDIQNFAGC